MTLMVEFFNFTAMEAHGLTTVIIFLLILVDRSPLKFAMVFLFVFRVQATQTVKMLATSSNKNNI